MLGSQLLDLSALPFRHEPGIAEAILGEGVKPYREEDYAPPLPQPAWEGLEDEIPKSSIAAAGAGIDWSTRAYATYATTP